MKSVYIIVIYIKIIIFILFNLVETITVDKVIEVDRYIC